MRNHARSLPALDIRIPTRFASWGLRGPRGRDGYQLMLRRLRFELRYLLGDTPWDTEESPPELLAFLEHHRPGRAIDLGCGTGTNVLTMVRYDWEAVGVDLSGRAIELARRKAEHAGLGATFVRADVTEAATLEEIHPSYDLALDLGCFHTLETDDHPRYLANLGRLVRVGGTCLLYSFLAKQEPSESRWPSEARVRQCFTRSFELESVEHGTYKDRRSAWFTWRRSSE